MLSPLHQSPNPDNITRASREVNAGIDEIQDTLIDLGFIDSVHGLSPEDSKAILVRKKIIQRDHAVPSSLATSLAYIDRMLVVQKDNSSTVEKLLATVDSSFVSLLIGDDLLAKNEEFMTTVVNAIPVEYKTGKYVAFSDALFSAIERRKASVTSELFGTIDGNGVATIMRPEDSN